MFFAASCMYYYQYEKTIAKYSMKHIFMCPFTLEKRKANRVYSRSKFLQ